MYFTQEDYRKIENWLYKRSIKDNDLPIADSIKGNEKIPLLQDEENKISNLNDIAQYVGTTIIPDFYNITENNDDESFSNIGKAIAKVPRKHQKLGLVITYRGTDNKWYLYQFTDNTLNNWSNVSYWEDILHRGKPNGTASLDTNGKVPLSQLPDDVKIKLELGETNTTAYPGNKGKKNADDIETIKGDVQTDKYSINRLNEGISSILYSKGKSNGIATLDSTGKVPLSQLPDNIGEGNNLELGETSTTAYPGDKGKKNANAISSLTNALDSIDSYSKTTRNQLDAFKNTKGEALGITPLDENGKVSSSYLPSYVDDVLEYDNRTAFPTTGESGKIYIALDTNKTYRWGGTTYAELTSSITLGETSSTAYAGDKGKKNREDINNLTTSVTTLSNNLNDVATKATNNATNIEDLTEDLGNTQGLLSNHIQEFKDYKQINAGIAEQVTELNTEVTTLKSNQSKFNTSLADVRSSFNNYASAKTPIIDKVEPHIADKQNPHEVTKAQVGLSNVTNDPQVKRSEMGANNGVATLDANGKIPESQLPASATSSLALGETEGTAYEGSKGSHNKFLLDRLINNGLSMTDSTSIENTDTGIKIPNENLIYNASSTDIDVVDSPINIPVADKTKTSGSGLLLNTDKKKLDGLFDVAGGLQDIDVANPTNTGITLGLDYYTFNKDTGETSTNTRNIYIPVADATKANGSGLMLNSDKTKLDSLSNYTLPTADSSTLGGIKIGSGLNIDSNGTVSVNNKLYILVNSLESVSTPDANKIYLVLNSSSTSETNSFTEYVWITSDTGGKWEKLGEASANVDLSNYYNKTDTNSLLSNKVDKVEGKGLSSNDYVLAHKDIVDNLQSIGSYLYTAYSTHSTDSFNITIGDVDLNDFSANNNIITIPVATTTKCGLMSSTNLKQHNTLYSIIRENIVSEVTGSVNNNTYSLTVTKKGINTNGVQTTTSSNITLPLASTISCGLMSKEDKTKLNNCITSIPEAGYNILGGIKPTTKVDGNNPSLINGTEVNVVDGVANFVFERTAEYVGANYKIIREATTKKYGLMSPSDKAKLDNLSTTGSSLVIGTTAGTAYDGAAGQACREDINKILGADIYVPQTDPTITANNITIAFSSSALKWQTRAPEPDKSIKIVIPSATTTNAGLMSAVDKVKLNNLSSGGSSITEYTEAEIETLLNDIQF